METGTIVEKDTNMSYEDAGNNINISIQDPELTYEKIDEAAEKLISMNDESKGGSRYLNQVFRESAEMLKIGLDNEVVGPHYKPEYHGNLPGEVAPQNQKPGEQQQEQEKGEQQQQSTEDKDKEQSEKKTEQNK